MNFIRISSCICSWKMSSNVRPHSSLSHVRNSFQESAGREQHHHREELADTVTHVYRQIHCVCHGSRAKGGQAGAGGRLKAGAAMHQGPPAPKVGVPKKSSRLWSSGVPSGEATGPVQAPK